MGMPTSDRKSPPQPSTVPVSDPAANTAGAAASGPAREIGGPVGPEPTRFGDWEKNGRCIDF